MLTSILLLVNGYKTNSFSSPETRTVCVSARRSGISSVLFFTPRNIPVSVYWNRAASRSLLILHLLLMDFWNYMRLNAQSPTRALLFSVRRTTRYIQFQWKIKNRRRSDFSSGFDLSPMWCRFPLTFGHAAESIEMLKFDLWLGKAETQMIFWLFDNWEPKGISLIVRVRFRLVRRGTNSRP